MKEEEFDYVKQTAYVVGSYVANNALPVDHVPSLIANVHKAMLDAAAGGLAEPQQEQKPAVPIKKSVTPDYIICLEDGKKYKSMKRHLRSKYNMSVEEYRAKWGLPADYPMVAPNYAKARSEMALKIGLGRKTTTTTRKGAAAAKTTAKPRGKAAAKPAAKATAAKSAAGKAAASKTAARATTAKTTAAKAAAKSTTKAAAKSTKAVAKKPATKAAAKSTKPAARKATAKPAAAKSTAAKSARTAKTAKSRQKGKVEAV